MGGKRGRVRRSDDQMFRAIDERLLGDGILPPENEYEVLPLPGESPDDFVGECFPSLLLMRRSLIRTDRKDTVQEKDSLLRPIGQIRFGSGYSRIALEFLEDIREARLFLVSVRNRKTHPHSGSRRMVRVLSEDHDLDPIERNEVEGAEDILFLREAGILGIFLLHERNEPMPVWFLEFIRENFFPRRMKLKRHEIFIITNKEERGFFISPSRRPCKIIISCWLRLDKKK